MCFDRERFIDQEAVDDLICSICQGVLCCSSLDKKESVSVQEPMRGQAKGGHKFCEKCILQWLNIEKSCPDCREPLRKVDLHPLDLYALNSLKKLKIRCKHYKNGCDFVDKLEFIEKHELNNCNWNDKTCEKCGAKTISSSVHTQTDCIERLVELLKEKDNKLNEKTHELSACKKNNVEFLKLIFEEANIDVNSKTKSDGKSKGSTLLMEASERGQLEIVQFLIEKGACVNETIADGDRKGFTALMIAAFKGCLDIVKSLIEKGANVNSRSTNEKCKGLNPLIIASGEGHFEIVKVLIENGAHLNDEMTINGSAGLNAISIAITQKNVEIVKLLIQKGVEINKKIFCEEDNGLTLLMIASQDGYLDIVKLLIERGASVNEVIVTGPYKGFTALRFATTNNRNDIVAYLKSKGAQ